MGHDAAKVLEEVVRLAPGLHAAGTFSAAALAGLVRHASVRPVHHSMETGSGASTLLFSHLSEDHTVFAMDGGTGSIRSVEGSPLMRPQVVRFVEGPTQLTLPLHHFPHPLQLALIDGPHGYPFPDLEYYYVYPHLDSGALLIVDDIHIPTITNLFNFLQADEMFDLQGVIETTAFFRRTDAPTFPPTGDGWWTQRYNSRPLEIDEADLLDDPAVAAAPHSTAFFVDQLGPISNPVNASVLEVPQGQALTIAGWALDTGRRRPAAAVDLVLDGARYRAPVRLARADVATAYADQAYSRCGFTTRLPARAISRGLHSLDLRVVAAGGESYPAVCLRFEAV